jgi:hypothetical protein
MPITMTQNFDQKNDPLLCPVNQLGFLDNLEVTKDINTPLTVFAIMP